MDNGTENSKAQPAAGIALMALSALLVSGVATFAGSCEAHDGATPTCHWAARAVIAIGVVACVLAIIRIFEMDEGERRGLSLSCSLLGFLAAAMPGLVIPLCMDATMHCNTVMRPFVLCIGIAIGLVGAVDLTRRLLALRHRA